MKKILYILAFFTGVVTAIGYVVGKGWEEDAAQQQVELTQSQRLAMWEKQAHQGDPQSQYMLGDYYQKERTDYLNAQKWYRVAATKGQHAGAQYRLAQLYMNGRGVENNMPQAMKWFRLSAAQGDARAQFFLGVVERDGWERKADFIEAYKWFLLSSKDAALVRAEDPRFDPDTALRELDERMSKFNRNEAQKRADKWRAK